MVETLQAKIADLGERRRELAAKLNNSVRDSDMLALFAADGDKKAAAALDEIVDEIPIIRIELTAVEAAISEAHDRRAGTT